MAKTIQMRFSSPFSLMQYTTGVIIKTWIDEINKASDGKVNIKLYPAGALAKAPEQFALCEKGIVDFSYHLADYTPGLFPMTSVFSLPFMVPSAEKVSKAMWETFTKEADYQKEFSKVKVLALFGHNGGDFFTTQKKITSMADFKGIKMRTANPAISEALKLWGAVPIAMPITETYQALSKNVVEGTVLNWEGIGVFKLDEVVKYATIAELYTMPMMFVMNKRSYEKLPQDVKDLIDKTSGLSLSLKGGKGFDDMNKPFRKRVMEKGVEEIKMSDNEYEKLKKSIEPLREKWVEEMTAKGFNARQVLDAALGSLNSTN